MNLIPWHQHSWGFPQREGYRDRAGRFVATGGDYQSCTECGARRECFQFAERTEPTQARAALSEYVTRAAAGRTNA